MRQTRYALFFSFFFLFFSLIQLIPTLSVLLVLLFHRGLFAAAAGIGAMSMLGTQQAEEVVKTSPRSITPQPGVTKTSKDLPALSGGGSATIPEHTL